jgi:hypothetical protein
MKKSSPIFLFFLLLLASCGTDKTAGLQPLRLLKYNVPLTILAPDSVKVETEDLVFQKGVTVRNDQERYFVQIWMKNSMSGEPAKIKKEQLEEAKKDPYFSSIVKDEENGFIFEKKIDSTHTNYDFRYVKVQGDKEYIFQTGFIGTFTQEEVEQMYESVKGE